MIQLLFSEVRFTTYATSPVVMLSELNGDRQLPIWTSAAAGAAIVSALEAEDLDHPATHDLLIDALSTQNATIEDVRIVACVDGLFHAQLVVNGTTVACRPSDGVALALRCGAPIYVADQVLAEWGIAPEERASERAAADPEADEVKQFREFLANVRADDFDDPDA